MATVIDIYHTYGTLRAAMLLTRQYLHSDSNLKVAPAPAGWCHLLRIVAVIYLTVLFVFLDSLLD